MHLATTVAYISVDRDVTTTNRLGDTAAGVQEPVSEFTGWKMHVTGTFTLMCIDVYIYWRECKNRFRNSQAGRCTYCGRNIIHDKARHVSNYHLDLAQLWRCPVSWCTQWKGTSQDCIDHIRVKHHVCVLVKTANLGRWFPPWTVTRAVFNVVVKTNVSGISTDMVLFSEHGT